MARKLIDQEEAAKMLGVSVEEINKMRDRKQLFPYRDGDAWKFKPEDIERVKQDLAAGAGDSWTKGGDFDVAESESVDSVLLSEKELGQSADSTSSTIIGKGSPHGPVTEGDIKLAGSPRERDSSLSDVSLAADISGTGSDVKLVLSDSDAKKKAAAAKPDSKTGALDDLKLEPGGSDKGASALPGGSGSDLAVGLGSDVAGGSTSGKSGGSGSFKLADDEIRLAEASAGSGTGSSSKKRTSDSKKAGMSDFSRSLELDEDVLSAKPDSDITRGATDSGIHLIDPKDSGLSLEEPLVLGGSAKELLELGEADVISLEESADMEGTTQLKSDEDFLLTPVQESTADESDSGSQVIALDADEELSSGAFTPATSGMVAMLEEDTGAEGAMGISPTGALAAGPALVATPQALETPYSGWNVAGLVCCALLLFMTGMMMYDLTRNMWQWNGLSGANSSIFTSIEHTVGWMDK
jgi:Helix-turn-helix domain